MSESNKKQLSRTALNLLSVTGVLVMITGIVLLVIPNNLIVFVSAGVMTLGGFIAAISFSQLYNKYYGKNTPEPHVELGKQSPLYFMGRMPK